MKSFSSFLTIIFLLLIFSCQSEKKAEPKEVTYTKIENQYAKGFGIFQAGDHTKVEIYNLEGESELLDTYFFSKKDTKLTEDLPECISVPIERYGLSSTTHASFIEKLGAVDNIVGLAWASLVIDPVLKERIENKQIANLTAANEVDKEQLISSRAQVFTEYPFAKDQVGSYREMGVPLILVSEYLESHPLARAEWIKFFGVLTSKENEADEIFKQIETAYNKIKSEAALLSYSPTVLIGSEQNGQWFMPGADSFMAHIIKDAGARYAFPEFAGAGNQSVDIELILDRADQLDYWGMVSPSALHKDQLLQDYERLKVIKAVKKDQIFYCNSQETDYFGKALLEPQKLLEDILKLTHPNLDKAPYFYFKKME